MSIEFCGKAGTWTAILLLCACSCILWQWSITTKNVWGSPERRLGRACLEVPGLEGMAVCYIVASLWECSL